MHFVLLLILYCYRFSTHMVFIENKMKRSTTYGFTILSGLIIWLAMIISKERFSADQYFVIQVLPWFLLISLGCYCLFKLGTGVLFFNNCHPEIKVLEKVGYFIASNFANDYCRKLLRPRLIS